MKPAARPDSILRQPEWVAALIASVFIVWLHFFFLRHAGGLWRDEVNLINLAGRHSVADLLKDSFPILMPLLVSGWTAVGLGQNDFSLRVLGALIGLGIPAAFWLAAWTSRRAPLFSLALFGLNLLAISYGDSLRAFGLGSLLIVLTAAAAWSFLQKPSWRRASILALAAILSVQALYQNAVLFAAIGCGAWVVCGRRKDFRAAGKILVAALLAAASLLPYWKILSGLPAAAVSERTGFEPDRVLNNLFAVIGFPKPACAWVWEFLMLVALGFGAAALFARGKKTNAAAGDNLADELPVFAGATLLAALVGFAGFLWFAALPTQAWYFLPLTALVAVCLDFGLPLPALNRLTRAAFFTLAAAIALLSALFAQGGLNQRFTNVDVLAQRLAAEASPQDYIIVTPWHCGVSFERYFKSATPWQTLPPLADHSTHRYDLLREQMKTPGALQSEWDQIAATLQGGHCVWVVGNLDIPRPGARRPADLPLPPLKGFGWSDYPYTLNWADQTAWYLKTHSRQYELVDTGTDGNVNPNEDLQLFKVKGWIATSSEINRP
jgi:hypothetical protein